MVFGKNNLYKYCKLANFYPEKRMHRYFLSGKQKEKYQSIIRDHKYK